MHRRGLSALVATVAAMAVSLPAAAANPVCPFRYTPELEKTVFVPEIDRLTSGHAADYRTNNPKITDDGANLRLEFPFRGLDGGTAVIAIDPCTQKIASSKLVDWIVTGPRGGSGNP